MTKTLRTKQHIFLCEQLKKARLDASLTQTGLAERLGKTQSYVAKVETHERRLDVVEFVAWMKACCGIKHSKGILYALADIK
ncbi:MAG: helix-turn-helix transcriptional regulator [Amylibacter sp.]|nr:helix-turn-helix transcriptional regulator [Amylibacter sp.]